MITEDGSKSPVARLAEALEDFMGTRLVGTWEKALIDMCEERGVAIVESDGPVPAASNPVGGKTPAAANADALGEIGSAAGALANKLRHIQHEANVRPCIVEFAERIERATK